jgi:alcohol dehydrogenase YqhD (iron-dependent ADH family)
MENFIAYNPTRLHFGRNVIADLSATVSLYGKKVLLVYGKGSVVKNGIYQQVVDQLKAASCSITEYSGIKPNPLISDVNAAAEAGRKNNVDVIVAVGGGSVIDSAKFISIAIPAKHDAWDFIAKKMKPQKAVPLIAVLTLAATGTEMNCFAVVQNPEARMKPGYGHPLLFPEHSFLDPAFTLSVPADQTAYGIVDLIAHSLEAYFGRGEASLSDRFVYSVISEAFRYGPELVKDLGNYELREKIMYAATCALNGMLFNGRNGGDWGVHDFGHQFSLLYDIPHGATLSMVYPAWMKHMTDFIPQRIMELGKNLWGIENLALTISNFEDFFTAIGSPVRISQLKNVNVSKKDILEIASINGVSGSNHKMAGSDHESIFDFMNS